MQNLTDYDLDRFFETLAGAASSLLMLDYDGTLAPFVPERDQAVPYPGVRERVQKLQQVDKNRVVVITGRPADDILKLSQFDPTPEIWGMHGAEHRKPDGTRETIELSKAAEQGLAEADEWARQEIPEDQYETKLISRGFHWRGLPDDRAANLRAKVLNKWREKASFYGLVLHEFDGGLELKVDGITKARAVKQLLSETDREAPVAYLGDDRTDEDAFAALGDRGLKVLVRAEPRPTRADIRITPPDELLAVLDRWLSNID